MSTVPDYAPASQPKSVSFVVHAKLIALLTLASRFLGLAREVVAGHYLGTGLVASAFTVAFTIPNLFRKLFGEGALSAAFIPLYSRTLRQEDATAANRFAADGVNFLFWILLVLTLIGEGILISLILFTDPTRLERVLTLKLAAIMLPYVVLVCTTAFLGGVLQVHRRFAAPAAAPVLLNLVHIAVVLVGARILHLAARGVGPGIVAKQTSLAYWLAFFVLVAGVMQLAVLLPSLQKVGFRFRFPTRFWTPPVRSMMKLTIPVAMGAGVLQLSVLLDKGISVLLMQGVDASGAHVTHFALLGHLIRYPMELGAPARLNLAQFLYQFPLGVFAIAIATAIFPSLSAEGIDGDREKFKSVLRRGIELTIFEGLPASIGLMLVAEPAVRLLFQHGQISGHDASLITRSVIFYSAAIWAFSLQQVVNRAYYALHDTKTPLIMSIITLAVNLLVEFPLLWTPLAEAGMAAGTTISFTLQSIVMLWMLNRRLGGLGLRQIVSPCIKMLIAASIMGVVLWAIQKTPIYPQGTGRAVWGIQLAILIAAGAVIYFTLCAAMGVGIIKHLLPKRSTK